MADTPILNYKGNYDGPEIDKAIKLALGLENPESCPYYVHVSLSQTDYVLSIGLGDSEGNMFNHAEIDLPLESMVVNATYSNGNIILHLQDGTSTEPIPISALIAGLVSETRTIAGIDLEDDITPKELRDALGVYTKDSVDQLVSDLENTINETLNEMEQSIKSDITINQSTIGFQSKNILPNTQPSAVIEGITYTVNEDGSITCNGTTGSTASFFSLNSIFTELPNNVDVVFSGCPAGGGHGTYGLQLYEEATPNAKIHWNEFGGSLTGKLPKTNNGKYKGMIVIRPNQTVENLTFYPMMRYTGTNNTYEPYNPTVNERLVDIEESVSELTPQVEQNKSDILTAKNDIALNKTTLGTQCKNIINKNISSGTIAGVTITVNDDKSITFNGTATQTIYYWVYGVNIHASNQEPLSKGRYILTGCPNGGSGGKYNLVAGYRQSPTADRYAIYDYGNGNNFEIKTDTGSVDILIQILPNTVVDNLTFYPMLRSADITDGTYEPYKPTLQEQINALVERIQALETAQTTTVSE